MKKIFIISIIYVMFMSCTNHLEKVYSVNTYNKDLTLLKEKGISKSEINSIKFYVSNVQDSTKLIGKTYEQIIIISNILQDSLVNEFKTKYTATKDTINIISKIKLIEGILDVNHNDKFANNEMKTLRVERDKQLKDLRGSLKKQKNSTKKIKIYKKILVLDKNDTITHVKLAELYIKKKWFKSAKKQISLLYDSNLISKKEHQILTDKYLIRKNPYALLKVTKGKLSEKTVSKGYSISNVMSGSGPSRWNVSSEANGYVTNLSKTLVVSVRVNVRFTVKTVTKVKAWFLTSTKRRTETINKSITLKNIIPGKSKSFSASAVTKQESYSYGNSKSEITDVDISLTLLSSRTR